MNSFATILGYLGTRIRQRLGGDGNLESLDDIFNYLKLDDRIATSGQPTEAQMQLIKNAGYTTVINLAPRDHENALVQIVLLAITDNDVVTNGLVVTHRGAADFLNGM